jgi:hypothetical protein
VSGNPVTGEAIPMDDEQATFHRIVNHNAGVLWELGAVEPTLAALWDLVTAAAGERGLRAALAARGRSAS